MSKLIILIFQAAWFTAASYRPLTDALTALGYDVQVPELPDLGLHGDTAFMRSYATNLVDAGHSVIALTHSYGGAVANGALTGLGARQRSRQNLPGGIVHLVYMTAYALPRDTSLFDKAVEMDWLQRNMRMFKLHDDGTWGVVDPRGMLVAPRWHGKPEVEALLGTMVGSWAGGSVTEKTVGEEAWRDIPVTYVYATEDICLSMDAQTSMVAYMRGQGVEVETVEVEADHVPQVTATGRIVEVLEMVAGRYV
ncbi:alpha/beta-hydrolase [Echria macrotheca]|uniref:Alpha/beta-hydrolase n=1 Tax=Echria macrotheca TaxID=438768 RepID=A0AAJ0F6T4_9PEZI|nr:alpha/beta-hydrolase [Echria macrotheca]